MSLIQKIVAYMIMTLVVCVKKLKITKVPHYSKKYTKGKILRAKDLSDLKNPDLEKVFYVKSMVLEDIFTEGDPP